MSSEPSNPVDFAARRAADDPYFLGSLLECSARNHDLDRAALADRLRCPSGSLSKLYLCRAPRQGSSEFRQDVEQAAFLAGCDPAALASLVREAQAIAALRPAAMNRASSKLLAARDADERPDGPGGNRG